MSTAELNALVDGRLPPGRRADVERRVESDPELSARVRIYLRQRLELCALHERVLSEPLPARLLEALEE